MEDWTDYEMIRKLNNNWKADIKGSRSNLV